MILFWSGMTALLIAVIGCAYLIVATILVGRFGRRRFPQTRPRGQSATMPGITVLKPLHGDEPGLGENLATFCRQNYFGPVQVVFGVADPKDAAIAVVERLGSAMSGCDLALVANALPPGSNRKVANLVNMEPSIRHPVIVLADSDIRVPPDYLSRLIAALDEPGIGAVTCPYYGEALGGFWSKLFALGINGHFLPNVIVAMASGLARPCFGSTIALRRETLAAIGGFRAFSDYLADDFAIGEAVRKQGGKVSVPPFAVAHMCAQQSVREVWLNELRWARTIRSIDPLGYAGSLFSHPFAWSILATVLTAVLAAFAGASEAAILAALAIGVVSLMCRIILLRQIRETFSLPPQSYWLVPARELLSFGVFVVGTVGRRVSWKDQLYQAASGGRALAGGETRKP